MLVEYRSWELESSSVLPKTNTSHTFHRAVSVLPAPQLGSSFSYDTYASHAFWDLICRPSSSSLCPATL